MRKFFVALFVALMTLTVAGSASAAVPSYYGSAPGDEIFVVSGSNGKVVVKDNYYGTHDLWAMDGSYTRWYMKDIDYFWVPGGCDAWNTQTGYKYVGNRTYGPMNGSHYLMYLRVIC